MSTRYLALLRGINVGGKNMLPMKELTLLFTDAGCRDVRTYIQSGNVLFNADPARAAALPGVVTTLILERFGYRVPLMLRTAAQISAVVHRNPFLARAVDEDTLHVVFLAGLPAEHRVTALDFQRSPPDQYVVRGQEIYLHLPNGMGRTKLNTTYFDAQLATTSTARNWRTVTTLLTLMES